MGKRYQVYNGYNFVEKMLYKGVRVVVNFIDSLLVMQQNLRVIQVRVGMGISGVQYF